MHFLLPATSANLGPGFDCLGIAWNLYNEISFDLASETVITGCDARYQNPENLALRGYEAALQTVGKPISPVRIHFGETGVPVSRGLGSSAALIAGGVLAADALHELHLTRQQMLAIGTQIEGHPDNLAPVFFGGLTAAAARNGQVMSVNYPLSDKLHFTALIPDVKLSTHAARSALPDTYPRADAVHNLSGVALLIKALQTGDTELLRFALSDKLHEPYRMPLIAHAEQAKAAALNAGADIEKLVDLNVREQIGRYKYTEEKDILPAYETVRKALSAELAALLETEEN